MAPKQGSEPIEQHFVAAAYLHPWGHPHKNKKKGEVYVWVEKKGVTNRFPKNTREILKVEHLYTIFDKDNNPDYSVENWFKDLEGSFSTVRRTLEQNPELMDQKTRETLALFTAAQYYRTPKSTELLKSRISFSIELMERTGVKKPIMMIGPALMSFLLSEDEVVAARQHPFLNFYLPRIEELAKFLLHMKLAILVSTVEGGFITSDCPAVIVDRLRKNQGLQGVGARLTLPISPKITVAYNWDWSGTYNLDLSDIKIENRIQADVSVEYLILPDDVAPLV